MPSKAGGKQQLGSRERKKESETRVACRWRENVIQCEQSPKISAFATLPKETAHAALRSGW